MQYSFNHLKFPNSLDKINTPFILWSDIINVLLTLCSLIGYSIFSTQAPLSGKYNLLLILPTSRGQYKRIREE